MSDATLKAWWDFANQKTLAARQGLGPTLELVRTTETRVFGPTGLIETIPSGVAGFGHDPVTGKSLGLSVQPARTNLVLQASAFATAPWTVIGTPIINANSVLAPDGTLTAGTINDNSGAAFEGVDQLMPISSAIATYTFSIYVKKTTGATSATFGVNWRTTGGSIPVPNPKVRLNTDTGEIQDSNSGINSVEDAGDYWRLLTQITTNVNNTNLNAQIFAATGAHNNFTDAAGITGIVTPWHAQAELGASATSPIPTTTTTVTRNLDDIRSSDVSWFSQNAPFTMYADFLMSTSSGTRNIWEINDGSLTNRTYLNQSNGLTRTAINNTAGLVAIQTVAQGLIPTKCAGAIDTDDAQIYANGDPDATPDVSGAIESATMTTIVVGNRATSPQPINGHIAEIRYYNVRKDNQFLEDLSNGLINEGGSGIMPYLRMRRGR